MQPRYALSATLRARAIAASTVIAVALTGTTAAALAQETAYPVKTVRIVVPFPAGGGADYITRISAQKLSEAMGQQFLVENRPGAAGNIGTESVARAAPNGYTLLSSSSSMITSSIAANTAFDVVRDFSHISTLAVSCLLVATHPSLPVATMKELIAIARKNPGEITYASSGSGTSAHMLGELLRQSAGADMLHVPYKGSAPIMTALLSGEVSVAMPNLAAAAPLAKAGKLRILAITCPRRAPALPQVPTMLEAGYPDAEYVTWWGLSAPASTPANIISRLNQELSRIIRSPDIAQNFATQGADPREMTAQDLNNYVRSEAARWQKVIRSKAFRS
jgi:tripartite-type tricarboxylate transporter receptor subunit TctC